MTLKDDVFEVGLSFNGIPERLVVPLAAIKGFFDPSVQFGLQFAVESELKGDAPAGAETAAAVPATGAAKGGKEAKDAAKDRPPARHKRTPGRASEPQVLPAPANPPPTAGETPEGPTSGAEVVRLDRFRKK